MYERYRTAFQNQNFPAAFVDLDLFDRNLAAISKRAQQRPIRLATKSVRCVSLIKRALDSKIFNGILAYSGWEAIHLAEHGLARGKLAIVLAYPIVNRSEIKAVLEKTSGENDIIFMVDRIEHLEVLNSVAKSMNATARIALDLDLSTRFPGLHFGVRRSWISSDVRMNAILQALPGFAGVKLVGAMGYEAQIAGVADQGPAVTLLKHFSARRVNRLRKKRIAQITRAGFQLEFVNGGGTGSLETTREDASVTELTAGSGLYSPALFDHYHAFHHEPAAGFALQITRKPEPKFITCFSGGYIASGSVGKEKQPLPYLPEGLSLLPHEGAGEVQTPLTGEGVQELKIGDPVFFRHAKAGELCERFNQVHLIRGDRIVETVPTYRGEGKNFG